MAMVCAKCSQVFNDAGLRQCPNCATQLLVHRGSADDAGGGTSPGSHEHWQQTAWGRIAICLALTQGLAFCLKHLSTAWMMANGDEQAWYTAEGLVWLNGLHGIALLATGMLAGANQERGGTAGAILGLWNGLVFLALHHACRSAMPEWMFYGQVGVHLVAGTVGGLVGYRIWRPSVAFAFQAEGAVAAPRRQKRWMRRLLRGPIHYVRIVIGAVFVVVGVICLKEIMEFAMRSANWTMKFDTHFQERMVRFEVAALITVLGSAFAGATTSNGLKQGLFVGIAAASLYVGTQFANPKATFDVVLPMSIGVFVVSLGGGAFGSTLFPPISKDTGRKAIPY